MPFMSHETTPVPRYTVQLGARGRIVLPAEVRRRLDLKEGDRLVLVEDGPRTLRLIGARDLVEQLRGSLRPWTEGRSLVDELSAERRRAASGE